MMPDDPLPSSEPPSSELRASRPAGASSDDSANTATSDARAVPDAEHQGGGAELACELATGAIPPAVSFDDSLEQHGIPFQGELPRRKLFEEVLSLVMGQDGFSRREIQRQCRAAEATFVTYVLKQLVREGWLDNLVAGRDPRYVWSSKRAKFSAAVWIEQQLTGTQVTQSPKEERPRERLLKLGPENLKTSELLAILIRTGRKGESAVQAGQKLANQFSDYLDRLPACSRGELKGISSAVSEVAYCQIMAGVELGRRVAEAAEGVRPKVKINSTAVAIEYCAKHFARLAHDGRQEEFHIVTLDTKLQPVQSHRITVGTLDASLVHPREVFRKAIRDAASAVLLVHNHPSGDPTPSRQDHQVTQRLKKAGEVIGINVIDHIVVAKQGCVSLAEEG